MNNTIRSLTFLLLSMVVFSFSFSATAADEDWPALRFDEHDRILILAPHPDDEVIACGGVIQHALSRGLPIEVVFYTMGDNNQWSFTLYRKHPVIEPHAVRAMGEVRHGEALAAGAALGLEAAQLKFLGYPDFGTLHIWQQHWDWASPFRSMLTHVTQVPYTNAFRPGAPYKGEEILRDLKDTIVAFRPTRIFVSHPGDMNPDHRSLYLFTRIALWDLEKELQPALHPFLVHHAHWPAPRGYDPALRLVPPPDFSRACAWQVLSLTPGQVETKERALKQHASQFAYAAAYLESFVRENEFFGDYPAVKLGVSSGDEPITLDARSSEAHIPDQLTEEERASFVGIEKRFIRFDGSNVVVSLGFSRPIARTVGVDVHLFGYRSDKPFSEMPKLRVQVGAASHAVYDQSRALPGNSVQGVRSDRKISLQIPLELMGNPERILTDARTRLSFVPLDWVAWRTVEVAAPVVENPSPDE
jgi:LmbE family N-acetylglucosaminyl deacetylase